MNDYVVAGSTDYYCSSHLGHGAGHEVDCAADDWDVGTYGDFEVGSNRYYEIDAYNEVEKAGLNKTANNTQPCIKNKYYDKKHPNQTVEL